jgi:RnlA-like RNase toxin of RnlAB toxin-antitoxin system
LIEYISGLDNINYDRARHENPKHYRHRFESSVGDKITLNIYDTGKLVIQGKPAYLYSEVISFLSYCPEVTIKDIVEANNKLQNIDIKVDDIREEIRALMPNSYGGIDNVIMKMLSPSFSFKKINMELEDYSCYAFPALRALEGYLKYLFYLENVEVGHSFGEFFDYNNKDGQHYLKRRYCKQISNDKIKFSIQEIYNYFNKNRHTLFHTEQILIVSRILENKEEADLIINEVINMIETTYTNINR